MTEAPIIRIEAMTRSHRHADGVFTLSVGEILIHPGEIAVFAGASGCGKSTLFDVLGLIAKPDSVSEFTFQPPGTAGWSIGRLGDRQLAEVRGAMVGYVLQHGGLIPSLSVEENIALPLRLRGLTVNRHALAGLASKLGISSQLRKGPAALSGGQQQRVAIARALFPRPPLVLADEPTGQLDGITATQVRDLLVGMVRDEGTTLLMVTHDPSLFLEVADRHFGFDLAEAGNGRIRSTLVEHSLAHRPTS